MNTRLTIDLKDPQITRLLRMEAAERGDSIRDIIVEALTSYFSHKRENKALLKLAEKSFAEWDNPKDSDYDKL